MSSFISSSRPWIVALGLLVAFEAAILLARDPHPVDRGSILELGYARTEAPQRLFTYHKLRTFSGRDATFVMSGDSSGLFGINPLEVEAELPPGARFYNLSCCANLGYSGYFYILEWMLRQNAGSLKYVVLHVTPYTLPRPETWFGEGASLWANPDLTTFGPAVGRTLTRLERLTNLPSLAWRRDVTWFVYNLNGLILPYDRPLSTNHRYLQFLEMYERTRGWMPEADRRVQVPATECRLPTYDVFDVASMSIRPLINVVFDSYARMVRRYGGRLIVVFQPVACTLGTGGGSAEARAQFARFQAENPDVIVPFDFITTWPSDRFSVPAHVKDEWRPYTSRRLGAALAKMLAEEGAGEQHADLAKAAQPR